MGAYAQQLHDAHLERRARLFAVPLERPTLAPIVIVPQVKTDAPAINAEISPVHTNVVAWEKDVPVFRLTVRKVMEAVCREYGLSIVEICSARRTALLVRPRQVAMYLAKTLTIKSMPEIGRCFGGRDHTTVLHAVRKVGGLLPIDPELAVSVAHLEAQLSQ